MLPKNAIEQMVSAVDNRVAVTTDATASYTYYLDPSEQVVTVNSALGVGTIYLPDVGEAKGLEYFIEATTGATQTVTVTEKASGNSVDFPGDASLNANYDRVAYKSDGRRWWIITDQYT
jgi:hypothetical protein